MRSSWFACTLSLPVRHPPEARADKKPPSLLASIPLYPTVGPRSSPYLINAETKPLPWPEQLALFQELNALRAACWNALLTSTRFAGPILSRAAACASLPRKNLSKTPVPALAVPPELLEALTFIPMRAEPRGDAVKWLASLTPKHEVLLEVWGDIQRSREGQDADADWLPSSVGAQFYGWYDRCAAAFASLDALRMRLATMNIGLVSPVARTRVGRGAYEYSDLVNEGFFGLLKAIDRFDVDRELRFSTYAGWWIRHAIDRALTNNGRLVRLPVGMQTRGVQVYQARSMVGNDPAEIAAYLGVDRLIVDRVDRARGVFLPSISLSRPVGHDDDREIESLLPDQERPSSDALLLDEERRAELVFHLEKLTAMDQEILRRRFGFDGREPDTLSAIADDHGLSRERIRQLQNRAIGRLRERMRKTPQPAPRGTLPKRPQGMPAIRAALVAFLAAHPAAGFTPRMLADKLELTIEETRRAGRSLYGDGMVRRIRHRYSHAGTPSDIERLVLAFLRDNGHALTLGAMSKVVGLPPWSLRMACVALCREGLAERVAQRWRAKAA